MAFGKRMAQCRKELKWSQAHLAERLGLHAPVLGRYERSELNPTIKVARRIAHELGTSLDYLAELTDKVYNTKELDLLDRLDEIHPDDKDYILKMLSVLLRDAESKAQA